MNSLVDQQRALLEYKFRIMDRLQTGLEWSFERLPALTEESVHDPAVSERISAIVDRFAKLQDQLAGALRHAHSMLGEKSRNFGDVIDWAVNNAILPTADSWLELRSLRNRLTHDYDLESRQLPGLIELVRQSLTTLTDCIQGFSTVCQARGLISD